MTEKRIIQPPKDAKPTPSRFDWRIVKTSTGPWRTVPDPTLATFAEFKEAFDEGEKARERINAMFRPDADSSEKAMFERNLAIVGYGEQCKRMLRCVLHPSQHDDPRIGSMSIAQMDEILNHEELWPNPANVQPVSFFTFKPAMLPEDAPERARGEFFSLRPKKARRLHDAGWFVLLPVAHLPLRSRMHTDSIRKKWPHMPKELRDMLQAPHDVIDEAARADQALRVDEWMRKSDTAKWRDFHRIISHVVVPAHDASYDEAKAEARAESFKHLPVSVAFRLAAFMRQVHQTSILASPTSSRGIKVPATARL